MFDLTIEARDGQINLPYLVMIQFETIKDALDGRTNDVVPVNVKKETLVDLVMFANLVVSDADKYQMTMALPCERVFDALNAASFLNHPQICDFLTSFFAKIMIDMSSDKLAAYLGGKVLSEEREEQLKHENKWCDEMYQNFEEN